MGTRHMQTVITKLGETKLDNYGQWDGYANGQGVDILNFLRNTDLDVYNEKVSKLREPTKEELKIQEDFYKSINEEHSSLNYIERRNLLYENKQYYGLSRDCGSDIHQLIMDGEVTYVNLDEEGHDHSAYDYTIDLQKRTFNIKWYDGEKEYSLDNLPTDEQFIKDIDNDFEEDE